MFRGNINKVSEIHIQKQIFENKYPPWVATQIDHSVNYEESETEKR